MQNQHDFIKKIISPCLKFEGIDETDKFIRYFCDLYRIEIFKDGLDLILTKLYQKDLTFEFKIIKGWDTNLGCYLTEQQKTFNKFAGVFSSKIKKTIIIKSFLHNVLAHEMAHALEFESGLDLNQEFRKAIALDMKNRSNMVSLQAEIKRLMVDALKMYQPSQYISELFARYFELLSISNDVIGGGAFKMADVNNFFINVENYLKKIFNPKIKAKINQQIAKKTIEIADLMQKKEAKVNFADKVSGFHKQTSQAGQKSFAKNVKSNAQYMNAWKNFEQKNLEDNKK